MRSQPALHMYLLCTCTVPCKVRVLTLPTLMHKIISQQTFDSRQLSPLTRPLLVLYHLTAFHYVFRISATVPDTVLQLIRLSKTAY